MCRITTRYYYMLLYVAFLEVYYILLISTALDAIGCPVLH